MHELPIIRGWQYQHAALVMEGGKTHQSVESVRDEIEVVKAQLLKELAHE